MKFTRLSWSYHDRTLYNKVTALVRDLRVINSFKQKLPAKIDNEGTIRIYAPKNNIFGSYNADGTTKTFFKPEPAEHGYKTNAEYWDKQPGVSPWEP